MATTKRRVPPGCCPGCLLQHETEPCALHRAAADLLDALRSLRDLARTHGPSNRALLADWSDRLAAADAAIAKAEGR